MPLVGHACHWFTRKFPNSIDMEIERKSKTPKCTVLQLCVFQLILLTAFEFAVHVTLVDRVRVVCLVNDDPSTYSLRCTA